jgi:hypothetical protein
MSRASPRHEDLSFPNETSSCDVVVAIFSSTRLSATIVALAMAVICVVHVTVLPTCLILAEQIPSSLRDSQMPDSHRRCSQPAYP